MSAEVTLRHGDTVVVVQGGPWLTLRSWVAGGVERLAAPDEVPPAYRVHGERCGVTFLHPWANRVTADAFVCAGQEVRLGPEVPRDPDGVAIHGLPGDWTPLSRGEDRCRVHRTVPASAAFPFAHEVTVEVRLDEDAVVVSTAVEADGPLPVAFGWHPYFRLARAREDAVLGLPSERAPLGDRTFDDGFGDAADTVWSVDDVEVGFGDAYGFAQVFAPDDCDVVALEPMTAPADALRTGEGLRVLAPGERFTATFRLHAASQS